MGVLLSEIPVLTAIKIYDLVTHSLMVQELVNLIPDGAVFFAHTKTLSYLEIPLDEELTVLPIVFF